MYMCMLWSAWMRVCVSMFLIGGMIPLVVCYVYVVLFFLKVCVGVCRRVFCFDKLDGLLAVCYILLCPFLYVLLVLCVCMVV